MSKNQFYRSLVAVAATAPFWLVPALVSQATEIRPNGCCRNPGQ